MILFEKMEVDQVDQVDSGLFPHIALKSSSWPPRSPKVSPGLSELTLAKFDMKMGELQ